MNYKMKKEDDADIGNHVEVVHFLSMAYVLALYISSHIKVPYYTKKEHTIINAHNFLLISKVKYMYKKRSISALVWYRDGRCGCSRHGVHF